MLALRLLRHMYAYACTFLVNKTGKAPAPAAKPATKLATEPN